MSHLDTRPRAGGGQGLPDCTGGFRAMVDGTGSQGPRALVQPPSTGPSWAVLTGMQSLSLTSSHPAGGGRHIKSALLVMHTYIYGSEGMYIKRRAILLGAKEW